MSYEAAWLVLLEDVTAVCILEGFQNPQSLMTADRVLKSLGQTKAKEAFKVIPRNRILKICLIRYSFMVVT